MGFVLLCQVLDEADSSFGNPTVAAVENHLCYLVWDCSLDWTVAVVGKDYSDLYYCCFGYLESSVIDYHSHDWWLSVQALSDCLSQMDCMNCLDCLDLACVMLACS